MAAKKEVILTLKTYIDGELVSESAKIVPPPLDWLKIIFLVIAIPVGGWLILLSGVFG